MKLAELIQLQRAKELRDQIPAMHAEYQRVTGMALPYRINYEYSWGLWLAEDWGKKELALVVAHIRKRMKQNRRYAESLSFRNLIGNRDRFAEDLAEATAENRTPRIDPERKFVLEATGRSAGPEPQPVTTAERVMRESKAFEAFRKWKAEFAKHLTDDESNTTAIPPNGSTA